MTIEWVKSRSTSYTGAKMRDFQTVQQRISQAAAKIDAAAALARNDVIEAQRVYQDGGNGIYDSHSLQRMFRDQHGAAGHINFSLDVQLPPWGLAALGGEFKSPTL